MNALHIVQRYNAPSLTGSEKAIELLCRSLAKQNKSIRVQVLTSNAVRGEAFYDPREPLLPVSEGLDLGVRVRRLPRNWWLASAYFVLVRALPFLGDLHGGWLKLAAFGPQLRGLEQAIIASKPDLIHVSPMPMSHVLSSWQIARRHHIPLVVTPTMHFDSPNFNLPIVDRVLKSAQGVIAHTQFEKNELVKRGVEAEKIAVIHSSFLTEDDFRLVDDTSFRTEHQIGRDPYVLFIGSKSHDKGTVTLLDAWPTVRQTLPNARLVIAGLSTSSWVEGKQGKDLNNVIELDYISDVQKAMALSGCVLLCVPSHAESFGMILLEAWAKKKPVIGGSAGATRELIEEGINGNTVEFGDKKDLAKKLIEILSKPKLARTMGESGFKKASQFTEKEMVDKTIAVYKKVAK